MCSTCERTVYLQGASHKYITEIQEYGTRTEKSGFLLLKSVFQLTFIQARTICRILK